MARADSSPTDLLELSLEFHAKGNIRSALRNYKDIRQVLEKSKGDPDEVSRLIKLVDALISIAQNDLQRNHHAKNLVVATLNTLDSGCSIPYLYIHAGVEDRENIEHLCKNYLLELSNWNGRLGNNLLQIANAIGIAMETHSMVNIPDHPYLKAESVNYVVSYLN